jgi:hypothetical protein
MNQETILKYSHRAHNLRLGIVIYHAEHLRDSNGISFDRRMGRTLLSRVTDEDEFIHRLLAPTSIQELAQQQLNASNTEIGSAFFRKEATGIERVPFAGILTLIEVIDREFKEKDKIEYVFHYEDDIRPEVRDTMHVLEMDTKTYLRLRNGYVQPQEIYSQ